MSPDFRREYLMRLPLPLAQLYSRAGTAKDARSRHDNTFYLLEALIKLAAVPGIAAYLNDVQHGQPHVEALDRSLVHLALPSLGQWVAMLRELAIHFGKRAEADTHPLGHLARQFTEKHSDHPALLALYRRIKNGPDGAAAGDQSCSLLQVFDALVQYRNGVFGHGGPRFEAFYEQEMGPLFLPAATEILTADLLDLLGPRGSRLVYLTEARPHDDGRVELGLRELVGLKSEPAPSLTLPAAQAAFLSPNRLAILWPGRPLPLRLDPLLTYRESDLAEEVLFLNRDRNGRQVEYLSYTTGRTERDRATATALAELLSRITGRAIDTVQLERLSEQSFAETPSVEGLLAGPTTAVRRGNYEILAELGRGGMGVVYLARQLSLGRLVALKMLPADLAGDEAALMRFRREVRALSRCEHPNIVKVLASGTLPDGQLFYTMEYVPGCDLERIWRELAGQTEAAPTGKLGESTWAEAVQSASRKQRADVVRRQAGAASDAVAEEAVVPTVPPAQVLPLPPLPEPPQLPAEPGGYARRVAALMRDAARALQAVHDQDIIHRDIKPANLMLTPDGQRLVLMDFGLAKGQNLTGTVSQTGGFLGSLRYAAPEQLAAGTLPVGPPADVRGLGATLWELLARRRLFAEAEDEKQLALRIHEMDVPRLRTVDPTLDRDLEAIVARATERRIADRIPTAGQLADYLQLYLDGKPLPIRPPGIPELARRWLWLHRVLVGAAAATVAIVVLLAGLVLVRVNHRLQQESELETDLHSVVQLQEQGGWIEARSILQRCDDRLAGTDRADLHERVAQARKDLRMAERLEEIPLLRLELDEGNYDNAAADQAYQEAYAEYGIQVLDGDPAEAASQIRASAIREFLVQGLDHWATIRHIMKVPLEPVCRLADLADNHAERKEIRTRLRNDAQDMNELVARVQTTSLPPGLLAWLAQRLSMLEKGQTAEKLLQGGWARNPNDCWANLDLGNYYRFLEPPRLADALGHYRAALAVRPRSAVIWWTIGKTLRAQGKPVGAEVAYRRALALKNEDPDVYHSLGIALFEQGKWTEAEAAYREAIRLKPKAAETWNNLGLVFHRQGKLTDAIAAYRQAIQAKPDHAKAYLNLGAALHDQEQVSEAAAAYLRAISLNPNYAKAYYNLGNLLNELGKLAEAESAFRRAIELKPDLAEAYGGLGVVLKEQGKLVEAEAAYRRAIALKKDNPIVYYNLGLALEAQGKLAEAETAYQQVIELEPADANAHAHLGNLLRMQGRLTEALAHYRKAHQFGSKQPGWKEPSAQWVAMTERLCEFDHKLSLILANKAKPASPLEMAALGELALVYKHLYLRSAQFYAEAFAQQPELADQIPKDYRYNAACAAAQVSAGADKEAEALEPHERSRWRKQALAWLRANLRYWTQQANGPAQSRAATQRTLLHWKQDSDLAGVREAAVLAKMPTAEQKEWQQFWEEVDAVLRRLKKAA